MSGHTYSHKFSPPPSPRRAAAAEAPSRQGADLRPRGGACGAQTTPLATFVDDIFGRKVSHLGGEERHLRGAGKLDGWRSIVNPAGPMPRQNIVARATCVHHLVQGSKHLRPRRARLRELARKAQGLGAEVFCGGHMARPGAALLQRPSGSQHSPKTPANPRAKKNEQPIRIAGSDLRPLWPVGRLKCRSCREKRR